MKDYQYNINVYSENEECTYRTNNIKSALDNFLDNVAEGVHTDIINGFTGEVLAIANCPEGHNYVAEEMALMIIGHLCAEAWGGTEELSASAICVKACNLF
jgi:hypothetical protein